MLESDWRHNYSRTETRMIDPFDWTLSQLFRRRVLLAGKIITHVLQLMKAVNDWKVLKRM